MFKKHPKGLTLLFSTELWERFSYYGMRALLVLYMTKALDYSDPKALGVYGAYGALVYATPLLGGLLAQGCDPDEAPALAVWLHGRAGDLAAKRQGARSMGAMDLLGKLSRAFRELEALS